MDKERVNILLIATTEEQYLSMRKLFSEIEERTPFERWTIYLEWVGTAERAAQLVARKRHDVYLIDADFVFARQHVIDDDIGAGELEVPDLALGFLQKAVAEGVESPFILLVDGSNKPSVRDMTDAGAADYIVKDELSGALLERSVRYVLKSHKLERLERAHGSLKRWARRRTALLRRVNQQLTQEITQREETKEALRQSEEKYRILVDNIQDGVFLVQDAKLVFANEPFANMLGYHVSDLMGQRFTKFIDPNDLKALANRQMQLAKGISKEYEFHLLHRDRSKKVMVNINVGLMKYQGQPASIGTVKDITVRKDTEEQLRKLSSVVHQSPISIIITDTQGNIEYVNPEFTKLNEYEQEEVIGQNPRILKSSEHLAEVYEQLWGTIAVGKTWRGELNNRTKSGGLYWGDVTISPIFNGEGEVTHYFAICEDITERRRIAAELRRHRHNLKELVEERTQELTETNQKLQQEINERRRMAETIRQSRERLRLQFNGFPMPTYTWQRVGRDFVLTDYNDAASRTINGRIIDFMGKKASNMFAGQSHILDDFKKCFLTKKTVKREAPYQLITTGEQRYFVTTYIYVPPNVVMVHMEDVTEHRELGNKFEQLQKRFEELIGVRASELDAASEAFHGEVEKWKEQPTPSTNGNDTVRLPLESSTVGEWTWDVETGEMEFSSEWAEMLGYSVNEVQEHIRSWAGLMHLDDIARVMDNLNSHFAGDIPFYEAEHRLRSKSGDWRWILGQGRVVERDEHGRALSMRGIHRDITERKRSEEALRHSQEWFQNIIEAITEWVWEMDKNMVYTYSSPRVRDILGYEADEIMGKQPFDFMQPAEAKRFRAVLTRRFKARKPLANIESICIHKKGHPIMLQTNGLPYFDADGLFCGYRGAHQDITPRPRRKK